jgi:hypothetical protein
MKIIENAFTNSMFDIVSEKIHHQMTPWFFGNTAYKTGFGQTSLFSYSFEHLVMDEGRKNSELFDLLVPLIVSILRENGETVNALTRIRLGMITVTNSQLINTPHVDQHCEHKTGLIYFSTTDAPTIFYKEKLDLNQNLNSEEYYRIILKEICTEDIRVDSVKNKMVLFDGLTYHSSSTPTDAPRRIVLNFNYV